MVIDRQKIIAVFKSEIEDYIQKLNVGFLALEKDPKDFSQMKELLRVAHSIKGASCELGFNDIGKIAHKMEDVLDIVQKIQKHSKNKAPLKKGDISKLLISCDNIAAVVKDSIEGKKISIDVGKSCNILDKIFTKKEKEFGKFKAKNLGLEFKKTFEEEKIEIGGSNTAAMTEEYVKVSLEKISRILNLTGELVINKIELSQKVVFAKRLSNLTKKLQKDIGVLSDCLKRDFDIDSKKSEGFYDSLHQFIADINRIENETVSLYKGISTEAFHIDPVIDELQYRVKQMRMLSCSTIFDTFPRLIRDIAVVQKKEVALIIKGGDTELDRKVLALIKSPLIHILRNCVDHGIEPMQERRKLRKTETSVIKLSARQEGDSVFIEIEDDGRGLDLERIKEVALKKNMVTKEQLDSMTHKEIMDFVFKDGFTTSKLISDISGRGVGLDVVRNEIEKLKGSISIDSREKTGTKLTLKIPLTIAVIKALIVEVKGLNFAIPMLSVEETVNISRKEVSTIESKMVAEIRQRSVPLIYLKDILELPSKEGDDTSDYLLAIIVNSLEKRIGFIVDKIVGEQNISIKSLSSHLGKIKDVSGATILGTGEIIVVLDVTDLLVSARMAQPAVLPKKPMAKKKIILIVEDVLTTRELEKSILEAQGYVVDTAIDGIEALSKVEQKKFDLLMVDIEMPRMDGFTLCEKLKGNKNFKDIPVIICTALEKEEDRRRGLEAGAQAYIVKGGFDQAKLVDAIERLIG